MTDITNFVNFQEVQQQVAVNVVQCGICQGTNVTVNALPNGTWTATCLGCGTTEIQPTPANISLQQTQAQFTNKGSLSVSTVTSAKAPA